LVDRSEDRHRAVVRDLAREIPANDPDPVDMLFQALVAAIRHERVAHYRAHAQVTAAQHLIELRVESPQLGEIGARRRDGNRACLPERAGGTGERRNGTETAHQSNRKTHAGMLSRLHTPVSDDLNRSVLFRPRTHQTGSLIGLASTPSRLRSHTFVTVPPPA